MMILETNSQGSLYCTFDEKDIGTYFSMSTEEFLKNKSTIEQFSDILIRKARGNNKCYIKDGDAVSISIYSVTDKKYAISIEREKEGLIENNNDALLTETDLDRMVDYLREMVK